MLKIVAGLSLIFVAGSLLSASATSIRLKKESVRGMKDGAMVSISAEELPVQIEAERVGAFYQFEHNGNTFKLRVSDVTVLGEARQCLPGEKVVIAENATIGGTQMGSGDYDCK